MQIEVEHLVVRCQLGERRVKHGVRPSRAEPREQQDGLAMALALELKKGSVTKGPPTEERAVSAAPAAGEKPGRAIGRKVTAIADVTAVDTAKHVVTLKGPRGNQVDLDVHDPDQLKNINVGDHVHVTYIEALAVSVETTKKAAAAK